MTTVAKVVASSAILLALFVGHGSTQGCDAECVCELDILDPTEPPSTGEDCWDANGGGTISYVYYTEIDGCCDAVAGGNNCPVEAEPCTFDIAIDAEVAAGSSDCDFLITENVEAPPQASIATATGSRIRYRTGLTDLNCDRCAEYRTEVRDAGTSTDHAEAGRQNIQCLLCTG